jgi:hypothetical protein
LKQEQKHQAKRIMNSKITGVVKGYLNEKETIASSKRSRAIVWTKKSNNFKQEQQSNNVEQKQRQH